MSSKFCCGANADRVVNMKLIVNFVVLKIKRKTPWYEHVVNDNKSLR